MADTYRQRQVSFLRKLQLYGPLAMVGIGIAIYLLTPDWEFRNLVSGIVAFLAIPDFLTFKLLADNLEKSL